MAYYVLVINSPNDSVTNLKSKMYRGPGNVNENTNLLMQFLQAYQIGAVSGTLQISVRDTDPIVATSGSGSVQTSHSK